MLVLAGRLVWLQGIAAEPVAAQALAARLTAEKVVPAPRGTIRDASGVVMATSVERYSIVVDQKAIASWKATKDGVKLSGAADAAALMAPILGVSAPELGAKLVGERRYRIIARDVLPEVWKAISDLRIDGVSGEMTYTRDYPQQQVAGNLLGWVNRDGVGATGVESTFEDVLAGTAGSSVYERGGDGQQIPGGYSQKTPAVSGDDVSLTLNSDLQWKAEQAIAAQVAKMGASSGVVVVLDVKTQAVLAMADSSTVNPNNPGASADLGGSSAVTDMFDPGSTAKVIAMAGILENGVATPTSPFEVPDTYATPNGEVFHDSHPHGVEHYTLTGILANSSNTGTVMVGQNVPVQVRYDLLSKFGFGARTGIELPSESPGTLHSVADMDGRTKYAIMFGQGVSVTALQAASVFATVANHGVRMTPHLVAGTTSPAGTFSPNTKVTATQVITPGTADTLMTMLESAVDDGTGANAGVPGYRIAGKTGTAQKFNPDGITASFVGVAPADNPQFAIAVIVHDPKVSIWGSIAAAPVFSEVAAYALDEYNIAPSGTPATLFPTTW